jgi:hypothetical protein
VHFYVSGHLVVAEAGCNLYFRDINVFSLSKNQLFCRKMLTNRQLQKNQKVMLSLTSQSTTPKRSITFFLEDLVQFSGHNEEKHQPSKAAPPRTTTKADL